MKFKVVEAMFSLILEEYNMGSEDAEERYKREKRSESRPWLKKKYQIIHEQKSCKWGYFFLGYFSIVVDLKKIYQYSGGLKKI